MQHIIVNPHNGAPVEHDGVSLAPGHQVLIGEREAQWLLQRFGFLLHHLVEKSTLKPGEPKPLKGTVSFSHVNRGTGEVPMPDAIQHISVAAAVKKAAAKKTAKKAAK